LSADSFDYISIAALINKQNPDIIWIGLGAPKQEVFMHHLLPHINKGLMIGVGAAFNYYSGLSEFKRAPDFMINLHLEWLFRAFQEPKRIIKRQLKNLLYLPLIIFNEFKIKK
jgi:N-acetylglucosaminyldiphosphoundecaprenol N-acetyl-beta-D-mannosaminyltransferase